MPLKWICIFLSGYLVLFLQGCETAKGFSKDVKTTFQTVSKADDVVKQADAWMQENLW